MGKHKRACQRQDCRLARAEGESWKRLAQINSDARWNAEGRRQCALEMAGELAMRLAAAHRARDAALGDAASLRTDLRTALASLRAADQAVDLERGRAKSLRERLWQRVSRAEALETKLEAMREERDHAREALDTAAEALGEGAEENEQLRATVATLARQFSEAQTAAQVEGARAFNARRKLEEIQENALRFVPPEGLKLPDDSWVFRLPAPAFSNVLARRQGQIRAAHIRALHRLGEWAEGKPAAPAGNTPKLRVAP